MHSFFLQVFYSSPLSHVSASAGQTGLSRNSYQTHELCFLFSECTCSLRKEMTLNRAKGKVLGHFQNCISSALSSHKTVDLYILLHFNTLLLLFPPFSLYLFYDFCPPHFLRLHHADILLFYKDGLGLLASSLWIRNDYFSPESSWPLTTFQYLIICLKSAQVSLSERSDSDNPI